MHENAPSCEHCHHSSSAAGGRTVGESLWSATATGPSFPALSGDTKADVVIVGGGITGLTTAYLLQKAGRNVTVVESNKLGQGVTGYTSAHLTYILDAKFQDLVKRFGVKKMRLVQDSNEAALATIARIVKEEHIDCDWSAVDGYLYAETEKDEKYLRDELEAAKRLGIAATYTKDVPLPFPTFCGIRFPDQAQFHPLKYIFALAKIIADRGGKIIEGTRVTGVKGRRVVTESGIITAEEIILATHAQILSQLLTVQAKTAPSTSYILGVRLKNTEAPKGLFWDTDHPYQYIRTYHHEGDAVVVIGGKDHPSGTQIDTRAKIRELEHYARKRFEVASIAYAWSAMYFTACDELPYIGRAPFKKHLFVATGYAGNGLTFGTVAALLLTDMLCGKKNPCPSLPRRQAGGRRAWRKIYSPNRLSLAGILRLMRYGWNNFRHVALDRFARRKGTLEDVKPGEGTIATVKGKTIALYRDPSGKITKLSPICTHAGCTVAWNAFEKTWDCPCHGGRYSPTGKVLNGPPVKDLAPVHE